MKWWIEVSREVLFLEVDISKKVNKIVVFGLAGIVAAALICSAAVWFWHSHRAYMTVKDAKIASTMVSVKAQAPGTIEEVLAADGDAVSPGQVIAKIKVKVSDEQIKQLEQSLDLAKKHYTEVLAGTTVAKPVSGGASADTGASQADVERAAKTRDRMQQLYAIGAISAVRYQQAEAQYEAAAASAGGGQESAPSYESVSTPSSPEAIKAAQIQVNQAQLALDTAKKNMEATEITAPIAGTLYYTQVKPGTDIAEGQPIFNIGDAANIWLELSLTKEQKDSVRLGQFVSYTIDGKDMQGTVLDIEEPKDGQGSDAGATENAPAPDAVSDVVKVKVSLPSDVPEDIKPGVTAVARIALNG